MEKVENWVAQGDLDKSGNQVDGQMPRWDSSEKAGPNPQIGSSISNPQKMLTYGLKKHKGKSHWICKFNTGPTKAKKKGRGGSGKPNKAQDQF